MVHCGVGDRCTVGFVRMVYADGDGNGDSNDHAWQRHLPGGHTLSSHNPPQPEKGRIEITIVSEIVTYFDWINWYPSNWLY